MRERANILETHATRISRAATKGDWNKVKEAFDRRQSAKVAVAANDAEAGADLLAGVGAAE